MTVSLLVLFAVLLVLFMLVKLLSKPLSLTAESVSILNGLLVLIAVLWILQIFGLLEKIP